MTDVVDFSDSLWEGGGWDGRRLGSSERARLCEAERCGGGSEGRHAF